MPPEIGRGKENYTELSAYDNVETTLKYEQSLVAGKKNYSNESEMMGKVILILTILIYHLSASGYRCTTHA